MRTTTTRYAVAKHRALRKGKCPVCGKAVKRSRVFECTVNPFNTWEDGTPLTLIEVMGQAMAMAEAWEPDFTHDKCRSVGQ